MADGPQHLAARPGRRLVTLVAAAVLAAGGVAGALAFEASRSPDHVEAALPVDETTASTAAESTTTTATATTVRGALGSGEPVTIAFAGDMNFDGVNRARLDADPATVLAAIAAGARCG